MDSLTGDYVVLRIGQLKKDRVHTRSQSDNDDSLAAGIDKVPRSIVYGYMDMTNSRRHRHGALAKHR